MYVVDSGLAINSPYPLLLRPQRNVDILLSFDFSARNKEDEMPFGVSMHWLYLEQFSLECRKYKTKIITHN